MLIDPKEVEARITPRTKAIIGVDYAGQPCDWESLRVLANKHDLALIADSCHAIGAEYKGHNVGTLADMTIFSFHPVKHITTGEGGMIVTDDKDYSYKLRIFRSHGITTDARTREKTGAWFYEMVDLGYNYRISDIQCALGLSQLEKLPEWIKQRQKIAGMYDQFFAENNLSSPLTVRQNRTHVYHLYVVQMKNRDKVFSDLREQGIGVNVHYVPVHLHPYYQKKFGYGKGLCPVAEKAYEQLITLPLYPGMTNNDVKMVERKIKYIVMS
jgi:dTDP-4-amino-4,6-dideoxygalactose transaminase